MSFHWQWDTTTTTTTTTRTTTTTTPASCRSLRSVPARFHCGRCSCCGHFCGLRFRAGNQAGVEWVGGRGVTTFRVSCVTIQNSLEVQDQASTPGGTSRPPPRPPARPQFATFSAAVRHSGEEKKNNNEKVRFGAVRLKTFMCLRKKQNKKSRNPSVCAAGYHRRQAGGSTCRRGPSCGLGQATDMVVRSSWVHAAVLSVYVCARVVLACTADVMQRPLFPSRLCGILMDIVQLGLASTYITLRL